MTSTARITAGPRIRVGAPGTRYATVEIDLYAALPDAPDAGAIHLTGTAVNGMHTSVNNKAGSARYHRDLYALLRDILIAADRWPEGLDAPAS